MQNGGQAFKESLLPANIRGHTLNLSGIMITGRDVHGATRKGRGKAPGPDRWTCDASLAMGTEWWDSAARLWERCLRTDQLPRR